MPGQSIQPLEWRNESGFLVSTDRELLQRDRIHAALTVSTWSPGIDPETVNRAIDHSLCFGLYRDGVQVGFGRFITDYATFAYMADVYVDPTLRGQGFGRFLVDCMLRYPGIERYRRLLLATTTAAWLYQKFGFEPPANPSLFWQINRPNVYAGSSQCRANASAEDAKSTAALPTAEPSTK